MKRYIIFLLTLALTSMATAQNNNAPRVSRGADRNNRTQQQGANATGTGTLSVRAQILNEQLTQEIGNAGWMRTVYRELDLLKEKNTPLYYPTQELNGSVNFFTSIFRLVSEGKIKIYRYLDGYEAFDDDNKLEFKDMLDNFNIFYEIVPASGNQPPRYIINSSDVPSGEVKTFLIKEAWYFDRNNSLFDVKTLAVCPIAYIIADAGGLERRMPMFWVKYEDIRPYVKNNFIMTSNLNNAKTFTVDDFFRRRMFEGDIVKTENLMNLVLNQYCPTPDSLEAERKRIENQLVAFNDSLWIKPDTTVVLSKKEQKKLEKESRRASKSSGGVSTDNRKTASTTSAPKPPKPEKSAPTRSIRR